MSFQAMAWAVKQKVGNATGKAILLMLANYADERGECFPSQETLASECECSKRSVLDWLQKFEAMGLLTRERRHTSGGYRRADLLRLSLSAGNSREIVSGENPSEPKCSTFTAEPITEPIRSSSLRSDDKRTPRLELETVLDADRTQAVIDHRQRIRKPLTAHAAKLLAGKFAKCPDPNAAADAMIANGWQGFEPEWMERRQARGSPAPSVDRPLKGSNLFFASAAQDYEDEQRRNGRSQGFNRNDDDGVPVLTIDYQRADG